jgi:acid phosphatase
MPMKDSDHSNRVISRRSVLGGFGALGIAAAASRVCLASSETSLEAFKPVRFAVIGDWGNGKGGQMAIGERIARVHGESTIDLILSVGDNIYPDGEPEDFGNKFERPYAALIKQKVPFYTVFGNHDVRKGREAQLRYPLFNMNGNNYYTVSRGNGMVDFFMLDSTAIDARQVAWADKVMAESTAVWKVVIVHHPPYSSGKRHGSDLDVRKAFERLFVRHNIAAVFSGDDHLYQRVTPQQGVQYFVTGAAGKIRKGDLKRDGYVAAGFDEGNHFMVVEANMSSLSYRALDETGAAVDSGTITAKAPAVARLFERIARRA